jgi:hypothetical protein
LPLTLTRGGRLYGYNEVTEPTGRKIGQDTVQCAHCNTTIFLDPKVPSPWCSCCDQQHCFKPECFVCTPFMRKIEAEEKAERAKLLLWRACDNI